MSDLNTLLQTVINSAYQNGVISDSEAEALEQRFLGDWDEQ